ncbi:membrane-spanning 4-domains subfamily A member 6A-like isoform X2 [Tamandua tetradactyla]|uniref:membrane-spanning 4-domains subfamily A member 6A-like isoform X2 n=1 Tax=Tamandua tetradactyla TaxID=48850 RepID=UPI0040539D3F
MMTLQSMPNETIVVLTSNDIKFPQAEKPKPTDQIQDSLKKHLKAEVKVLATIQIMCGGMVLSLGLMLASAPFSRNFTPVFSILLKAVYPFVGSLCFIISGSLSIITEKKSTKPLVQSSLVANILSSLFAVEGLILLSVNLAALGPATQQCELEQKNVSTQHDFYHYHNDYVTRECSLANGGLVRVLFLPQSCKNTSGMIPGARCGSAYEELLTS